MTLIKVKSKYPGKVSVCVTREQKGRGAVCVPVKAQAPVYEPDLSVSPPWSRVLPGVNHLIVTNGHTKLVSISPT